mmetsp:Transcript_18373/g.28659  ORF Transcript_18373/g.28659 Transcript_18373/m.28659 type:complete len:214 (-) Transcript_18373:233-874(-)
MSDWDVCGYPSFVIIGQGINHIPHRLCILLAQMSNEFFRSFPCFFFQFLGFRFFCDQPHKGSYYLSQVWVQCLWHALVHHQQTLHYNLILIVISYQRQRLCKHSDHLGCRNSIRVSCDYSRKCSYGVVPHLVGLVLAEKRLDACYNLHYIGVHGLWSSQAENPTAEDTISPHPSVLIFQPTGQDRQHRLNVWQTRLPKVAANICNCTDGHETV